MYVASGSVTRCWTRSESVGTVGLVLRAHLLAPGAHHHKLNTIVVATVKGRVKDPQTWPPTCQEPFLFEPASAARSYHLANENG